MCEIKQAAHVADFLGRFLQSVLLISAAVRLTSTGRTVATTDCEEEVICE
jgi:hypothetical protein